MTNAEVAAHFAALPADETAELVLANLDNAVAQVEDIVPFTDVIDQIEDEFVETAKGKLCIWQQY